MWSGQKAEQTGVAKSSMENIRAKGCKRDIKCSEVTGWWQCLQICNERGSVQQWTLCAAAYCTCEGTKCRDLLSTAQSRNLFCLKSVPLNYCWAENWTLLSLYSSCLRLLYIPLIYTDSCSSLNMWVVLLSPFHEMGNRAFVLLPLLMAAAWFTHIIIASGASLKSGFPTG